MPETADPVVLELSVLHRGRGLRRPTLGPDLGPELRRLLNLGPDVDEATLRFTVAEALIGAARTLAPDLRTAFLHALAVKSAHRLLRDRLDAAGAEIDRDARTVRRRLEAANAAVAQHLRSVHAQQAGNEIAPTGWSVTAMTSVLDLRPDRPTFTADKTILAVQRVASVTESFFLPRVAGPDLVASDIEVEVLAGGRATALTRVAARNWRYDVTLDQRLLPGEDHTYSVRVTLPDHHYFAPYNAVAPLRPCALFDCRVFFAPDCVPPQIERIDGLPSSVFNDEIGDGVLIEPAPEVFARFTGLAPGLAYGLRWA